MKKILLLLFCFIGLLSMAQSSVFPPSKGVVECSARGGLPNFYAKIARHDSIRIAYLGGSITEQAGWRVKTLEHFKKRYPDCKFSEINAAIGGTGSDLGVLRIEHDVLVKKPDLLFVEFAVNDSKGDPTEIAKAMEGIVRKTWKQFPACDICFVYTLTDNQVFDSLKVGKLNLSAAVMEVIADYYNLPSIHLGIEVIRLLKEGKLVMKAPEVKMDKVSGDDLNQSYKLPLSEDGKIHFSKDGVHPYTNTGHQLYLDAIVRSLPAIEKQSKNAIPHQLGTPYNKANYENSSMLDVHQATRTGDWVQLPKNQPPVNSFANRVNTFWRAGVGATLTVKFKGSSVKIYDVLGPDAARLEVTLDGKVTNSNRFDGYCTYWRLALLKAAANQEETKVHELTIRVLPDKLDKRNILFEQNRADFDKNLTKYDPIYWYVGAIFVVGELVK